MKKLIREEEKSFLSFFDIDYIKTIISNDKYFTCFVKHCFEKKKKNCFIY